MCSTTSPRVGNLDYIHPLLVHLLAATDANFDEALALKFLDGKERGLIVKGKNRRPFGTSLLLLCYMIG